MITTVFKTWVEAIKALLKNPIALALFAVLYALLLASLYAFVAIREATVSQVAITLLLIVMVPAEFFICQATILVHARGFNFHWRAILIDACKQLVVTIPILIIGYVFWILLNKWQLHYPAPRAAITFPPAAAKPQPLHWPTLLFVTARFLIFGLMLPLATIHLWIGIVTQELRTFFGDGTETLRRLGQIMARAFASSSVLIYALGAIFFALIPYALLFVHIPVKGTKTDFVVFIARLALVFVFTLVGWIVTLSTLARNAPAATGARQDVTPGVSPGNPAASELLSPQSG